jgi:excisionase family DNA binding protein
MEIPARLTPPNNQYQADDERLLINELRFNRLRTGEPEGGRACHHS